MTSSALLSRALPYLHLNFREPFQWSSGYAMPVFFDAKSFLAAPDNRAQVREKLQQFLPEKYQTLAATPLGGVTLAASLAGHLSKPLAFFYRRNLYRFTPGVVEKVIAGYQHYSAKNCDIVVSTAPFGIVPGVHLADTLSLPFAYIRRDSRMRGMQQLIEGLGEIPLNNPEKKLRAIFIDWYEGKSYGAQALRILEEQGIEVMEYKDMEIPSPGKGKLGKTVHIEDVIGFGSSSLRDIGAEEERGATIELCMALFSYHFSETVQRFSRQGHSLHSALTFEQLLAAASRTEEEKEKLKAWHQKPRGGK